MDRKKVARLVFVVSVFFLFLECRPVYAGPLTLKQAETAALSQSPEIKSLHATKQALEYSSIAAGQLSDPKLMLGSINVPVDTFDFSQEPMTQIQVGLIQNFPRGRSLHYRALEKKHSSVAQAHKQEVMRLHVLQGVRLSWLHLYYWIHAKQIIIKQKKIFRHLVKVTEMMLANNKAQQKDVIRAQLELTELDNRVIEIDQQIDTTRAALARWIGQALAYKAAPKQLPTWPTPPNLSQLHDLIQHHAELKTDEAFIAARQAGINLAKQQYKPGFGVGATYGFRQGRNLDNRKRPDFLTARISVDLPLFTRNRQDQTLKASEANFQAIKEEQMSDFRQLAEALKMDYAAWKQQQKSAWLYRAHLVPEATQYAKATKVAYQNAQTDFLTLARAYIRELNTELAGLKAAVNRDGARVNLLYLQGR